MNKNEIERRIRASLDELASREAPTKGEVTARIATMHLSRMADAQPSESAGRRTSRSGPSGALTMVAAAGVIAVVLVGVSLALGEDGSLTNPSGTPTGQQNIAGIDDPTAVGRGRAVVSIPGDWSRGDARCGIPQSNTVIFEFSGSRACFTRPTEFDTITIGSAESHDHDAKAVRTTMNGVDVFTSPMRKQDGMTLIELLVPSEDAWFLISAREPVLAREIADSLRLLPEGQTTMPDIYLGATGGKPGYSAAPGPEEITRRLEHAGLTLKTRYVGDADPDHWSSLKADAVPGTVLPVGTEITVIYAFGGKSP